MDWPHCSPLVLLPSMANEIDTKAKQFSALMFDANRFQCKFQRAKSQRALNLEKAFTVSSFVNERKRRMEKIKRINLLLCIYLNGHRFTLILSSGLLLKSNSCFLSSAPASIMEHSWFELIRVSSVINKNQPHGTATSLSTLLILVLIWKSFSFHSHRCCVQRDFREWFRRDRLDGYSERRERT